MYLFILKQLFFIINNIVISSKPMHKIISENIVYSLYSQKFNLYLTSQKTLRLCLSRDNINCIGHIRKK